MKFSVVELIQAMLAPGIMISACGLLLLGMNNKYSIVVSRIRILNEEKRKFFKRAGEFELSFEENMRLQSIAMQLEKLFYRVRLVRNAVLCYSIAVSSFVLTSLCVGTRFISASYVFEALTVAFFLCGMLLVFVGIAFAATEIIKGYDIISFEIKADE